MNEALGDRVDNLDVRIANRSVTIRAHVVRFWQRRTVRKTLESLPGLAGYRSTVELVE